MKLIRAFYENIIKNYKKWHLHYNLINDINNDQLMNNSIAEAFQSVKIHFLIGAGLYSIFLLLSSNNENILFILFSLSLILVRFLILFFIVNRLINSALNKNHLNKAMFLFYFILVLLSLIPVISFTYIGKYSDIDRGIVLSIVLYCNIYFVTIIPGNIFVKIMQYSILMLLDWKIVHPTPSPGYYLLIAHFIAGWFQIYFKWKAYHKSCKILNMVEYERKISSFLTNKCPEPIFTLSLDLNIEKLNEKAQDLLKSLNTKHFKDLAIQLINAEGLNLVECLKAKNDFDNLDFIYNKKGYQKKKIVVSFSHFEIEEKQIIIVILRDLTILLDKQEILLNEKYQNILLFSASHEIRSQLNLISGNLEQINKKNEPKLLKIAQLASKVLEYKLNLIIDFANLTSRKFRQHLKQFSFKLVMEEITDLIYVFAKQKNLEFEFSYLTQNSILQGDEERFYSILIHFLLNAIKYTHAGKIFLVVQFKGDYIYVQIKDSGIGMPKNMVEYLNNLPNISNLNISEILNVAFKNFEESKFLRGIGTLTSTLLIKYLEGDIKIFSQMNSGTIINLKYPAKPITEQINLFDDDSCKIDTENDQNACFYSHKSIKLSGDTCLENNYKINWKREKLKIIVVDDLPFNRFTLIEMLNLLEFKNVSESENGKDACEKVALFINDFSQIAVFMDIEMPVFDGIEATRQIKCNDPFNKVKIVMLSAFGGEEIIQESIIAGAIDFIVKPISFNKLRQLKEAKSILF